MTELKFHQELYDSAAVDEAVKIYGAYGAIDFSRAGGYYVLKVTINPDVAAQGISESTLCAEVVNYALGKTIESSDASASAGTNGAAAGQANGGAS